VTLQMENQKSGAAAFENPAKNPYAPPRPYAPGTRKIKVLLISHTCQSRTEGQPKAHALASLPDIDLHLLTPKRWMHYGKWRDAEAPLSPKFQTTIAPVRFGWAGPAQYFLHYYPSLPRLLKTFQPDIIDLWEEPWGLVSAHACRLRNKLLPQAKIISETEQNINKVLPFPFEGFRRYTLRHADYAVGRNREAIDVIRSKGYAGPAEVVPNAVDTTLFRPLDRAQCRAEIGRQIAAIENQKSSTATAIENAFLIGYAGRLVEEKGLMDALDALPNSPPQAHLLLLGSGPQQEALRQRAAELHLESRVHFLPARPLEQLAAFMNALDVFILPSRTTARWKEQFGRVIIEAHACGTPVIGSDSGAIPDVIADAGLVVPEKNLQAAAEAICKLAVAPELARQLGLKGMENARNYFTWQRVAERMATIYQAVMN
jgi:glycosyltransferase involved in cell wall biosynthesis